MNDRERLVDQPDEELRSMIEAARAEAPSAASKARAAAALGGAGGAAVGAAAGHAAVQAGWLSLLKPILVGGLAGLAVVAGAGLARREPDRGSAVPRPAVIAPLAAPSAVHEAAPEPVTEAIPDRTAKTSRSVAGPASPPAKPAITADVPQAPTTTATAEPAAPAAAPSIGEEIAILDRARRAMAGGDAAAALAALAEHDSRFPRGELSQEAEVLRIEALARGGSRAAARDRARAFLAAHPNAPQEARVKIFAGE